MVSSAFFMVEYRPSLINTESLFELPQKRDMKHFDLQLYVEDVEWIRALKQGSLNAIVRKIISDYVTYHKVKASVPLEEVPGDQA